MVDDVTAHRLRTLERAVEKDRQVVSAGLAKLTKSVLVVSNDLKALVREQTALTKAMGKVVEFQYEVKTMHATQQRLFGRVERMETSLARLSDEFHTQQARQEGKRVVVKWIFDHWFFVSAAVGALIFGALAVGGRSSG